MKNVKQNNSPLIIGDIPFTDDIKNSDGYKYYDELKLSIRNLNSTESIKEIQHMCDANKIKLRLEIKMACGDIIKITK